MQVSVKKHEKHEMQVSVKKHEKHEKHVKLAKYGCLRCGRFLFAPSWYQLYYNVVVCSCDAAHFKASIVEVPDHIQAYWDAQFCTASHSTYRRRLRRWTKRYLPSELFYEDAFSTRDVSDLPDWSSSDLKIKEPFNMLSGHSLRTDLKSRFAAVHRVRTFHPEHLFENVMSVARALHIAKNQLSDDDDAKLLIEKYAQGRP
ncbi:MAG: hypothetical protein ACXVH9_05095 [Halobacteriota archaeon]